MCEAFSRVACFFRGHVQYATWGFHPYCIRCGKVITVRDSRAVGILERIHLRYLILTGKRSKCCGAPIVHPFGWHDKDHCEECGDLV